MNLSQKFKISLFIVFSEISINLMENWKRKQRKDQKAFLSHLSQVSVSLSIHHIVPFGQPYYEHVSKTKTMGQTLLSAVVPLVKFIYNVSRPNKLHLS